jgi:hypothetical protein
MPKTPPTTSFTIRCPIDLMDSIEAQTKQTRQNKTDIILGMLLSAIPSLHITERFKLPPKPGIYFVYTLDHKLLYLGKADNLRTRWNSHHKYQTFIETSLECRIGYFTFDDTETLNNTLEEFQSEPLETPTENPLVTTQQLEEVQQQLNTLQKQFNDTLTALIQLGSDSVVKKLKDYLPPRGLQQWTPSSDDLREGITRSTLITKLNFGNTENFEKAAQLLDLDPSEYLTELSGWLEKPIEEGSSRTRFFKP